MKHGKLQNPERPLVPLSPIASLGLLLSEKNIMGRDVYSLVSPCL
jgi:hypothetical protein